MSVHRKSYCSQGLSLIEVLLVIALITFIGGFATVISYNTLNRSYATNDRRRIMALLLHARNLSVSSVCTGCASVPSYGVRFGSSTAMLISHVSTTTDEVYQFDSLRYVSGPTQIDFAAGSADVAYPADVVFADQSGTTTISINSLGRVVWSSL